MNVIILFRTSVQALRRHKIRSTLTLLGIMIGIAAIIVTFSIGHGAEKRIRLQILAMGENAVYIVPGNIVERGAVRSSLLRPTRLKEKDLESIAKQSRDIDKISRGHNTRRIIEYGPRAINELVYGVDHNMLKINGHKIKSGTFFNKRHVQSRVNVVVLGHELAKKLFKGEDPIGKTVRIRKYPFTVIGIVDYVDYFWGTQDPNLRSYVPFTVAKKYFRKPREADDDLLFIGLSVKKEKNTEKALRTVKRTLRFMHKLPEEEVDDFTLFDQQSIAGAAQQASTVVKLFGLITAFISLVVGGIGIMNIMLVSIKERTKEIGIRLAIGATQSMIQLQFLLEAIILTFIGGVIGLVFGTVIQYILSRITELPGQIELIPMLISFLVTIVIGISFGYYPARYASLLNPVDALFEK